MSQIRVIRELENMPQSYIDPTRAYDPHALPDLEVFQLTAIEAAEMEDDLIDEYQRRHEYRLAGMNSRVREALLEAIVDEQQITGGWYWWSCLPGCLPDSDPMGPFPTEADALADALDDAQADSQLSGRQ
mgnify:CR=1 FL=1